LVGVRVIVTTVALVTVKLVEACTEPELAVMVAAPGATPKASPPSTAATLGLEELQASLDVTSP